MKPTSQSVCRDLRQIDQQSNYILVNSKLAELNKPPQSVIPDSCLCLLDSSHTDKHTHTYTHTHTHTHRHRHTHAHTHTHKGTAGLYCVCMSVYVCEGQFVCVYGRECVCCVCVCVWFLSQPPYQLGSKSHSPSLP